ncbi:MAG: hypothetical protein JNK31_02555 [Candidatus Competibacter sp.]|nr:hypothetical protein [Candidatus Competibacter sp.]
MDRQARRARRSPRARSGGTGPGPRCGPGSGPCASARCGGSGSGPRTRCGGTGSSPRCGPGPGPGPGSGPCASSGSSSRRAEKVAERATPPGGA